MATRIATGLLLAIVVVGTVVAGPYAAVATLLAAAVLLALWEFLRLPATLKPIDLAAGMVAGAAPVAAAALAPEGSSPLLAVTTATILAVIGLLLVVLFTPHPMERAAGRATHMLAGLAYVALLGTMSILIVRPEHQDVAGVAPGRFVILAAAAVTWLNDTMAFFGGRLLGRHRMYEAVSPKKTMEGAVTGMAGSVLGAFAVKWLFWHDADPRLLAGFAVAGGLCGQLGDLAESVFKRSYGVKDSGTLLPGHGGLLDRIDAFLFVAPVAWVWFYVLFA